MCRDKLLDLVGHFTWCWGMHFFVETSEGNFVWLDPDYGGNNSFRRFTGTYEKFVKTIHVEFGRDKGQHVIRDYCGEDVVLYEI